MYKYHTIQSNNMKLLKCILRINNHRIGSGGGVRDLFPVWRQVETDEARLAKLTTDRITIGIVRKSTGNRRGGTSAVREIENAAPLKRH